MFIKEQYFETQRIVQVAQPNDFHLVISATLKSEFDPCMIKLAPRNTEAITSKSEEDRPKYKKIEWTQGRTRVEEAYGEAEETSRSGRPWKRDTMPPR